jgi:hypothetical protein
MKSFAKLSLAAFAVCAIAAPAMAAETGRTSCIKLMSVGETPVINERTILIKMKSGSQNYKRMDLAGPCSGIEYKGFAHQTGYDELCTSDTLTSLGTPGAVCKIDKIVDISDAEAKDLLKKK